PPPTAPLSPYTTLFRSLDPSDPTAKDLPESALHGDPDTPVAVPVFDGLTADEVTGLIANHRPNRDGERMVKEDGKARLFDGRSGEPFPDPISVGYMYMLK